MTGLPSIREMFCQAGAAITASISDVDRALDWMRSDWEPVGASLTDQQAAARQAVFDHLSKVKAGLERAKKATDRAGGGGS